MRRGPLALVRTDGIEPPSVAADELSLRVLLPLVRYVRNRFGEHAVEQLARDAGIDTADLGRANAWTSLERFEKLLAGARALVTTDQEFMRACTHDMARVYGPMILVLRCVSIGRAYRMMAGTSHVATKISRYEVSNGTRTSIRLRYSSAREESRLMCLSRQAQLRAGPTLYWGVAQAVLEEHSCIAHGDGCCEYTLRWYEPVRWRGPLFGAIAGLVAALFITPLAWAATWLVWAAFGAGGLLLGLLLEQRRLVADHLRFADETNRELEHLATAHARAVDEVLALHQRERQWSEQREAAIEERSARLDRVVERLQDHAEPRRDKLRNLSHDINNPLAVLLGIAGHLRRNGQAPDEIDETAQTLETVVEQISGLVRELASIVAEEPAVVSEPQTVEITELTDRLRRQVRATVVARDIRVTVFQTREAPQRIRTFVPMFERAVDNLLTNAAKYTDRGSIVVEVGGTPGYLLIKVSDTGRGIGPERLEQVLRRGGPDPNPPKGGSQGAGLGIVARLLDGLGGRLEIMSEPEQGTTLWVYIPTEPPASGSERGERAREGESLAGVIERVVRVRAKPTFGGEPG
jgi:signal transduction histidine kinase